MSIPQSGEGFIEKPEQMVEYLASGCKPKSDWRIGTEHEKFGYCKDTLKPIPYSGERSILTVLEGLRDEYGWAPILEAGNLIGLSKNGANVSLEPGGQLELSGAPLETIHETCDEVNTHLREVRLVADRVGVGFIGLGAAPTWNHEDMPVMPKGRYKLMTDYMDKVGSMGKSMMYRTCTVQVNLDFGSEADMVQKMRVALALQPVATALFANSPFFEGKPNGHQSWRSRIWRDLDADRTGMLPFVFEDGFGFEAWVDYALDVPMYFVYRDGKYLNALGQSFRDFLKGQLPALPGQIPTLGDWADHLTTIFPEARVKQFIEMRGADGGPWRRLCALPAFWVGLCYDQTTLDAAWDLVKDWDAETRENLRVAASQNGLNASVDGIELLALSKEVVALAHQGLESRARKGANGLLANETHFLNALHDTLASGKSPADELIELYNTEWQQDVSPIFDAMSY
ncbi:MAG: glutamate--cysteine ligase [Rhodobacteraceae bacterium]|jgi:glutamate--cysteine ligase|nr:glutamate--cysteine ligase [Marinovum sp.]MBQ65872.1 glutamate--cysteine ligase [Marinovum sp.]MDA7550981.1 glutamate--cysteine ligase [Paracoccaceae bacterium]MDG2294377.1 glutamate--cysteine ligase [Paracoccaceae bacterium]RZO40512.1 MAG: glutamate--cysteine ligase [Paracoccaceae bacterium]|tara:strand:- start:349 stop:1719 length:1371 start_codon:yes stop_codon:yes gene_type:complete